MINLVEPSIELLPHPVYGDELKAVVNCLMDECGVYPDGFSDLTVDHMKGVEITIDLRVRREGF